MSAGTIVTIALWAAIMACIALALSGLARMATTKGGARDAGCWHAPLIFASATAALLTAAGVLGILDGALLALAPLVAVTAIVWRAWRAVARLQGHGKAARAVLGGLWGRLRDAFWNAREDLRDLLGLFSRGGDAETEGPAGRAAGGQQRIRRTVPSYREDAALGAVPSAGQVSASLQASGVTVPPAWAALADWVAGFDPDDDEDELLEFVAGNAAGVLHVAEAFQAVAETLMTGAGLDPVYAEGFIEIGDETADLAAAHAMIDRRYHVVYGDIREFADNGGVLPHNSRRWFHAHGPTPEGGRAA